MAENNNNLDNHSRNLHGRIQRLHGAARRLYQFDPRTVTLVATISSGRNVAKTTCLGPCRASQSMETVRKACVSILEALDGQELKLKATDSLNLTVKEPLAVPFITNDGKPRKKPKTRPAEAPAADAGQAPAAEDADDADAESELSESSSEDDDDDAVMVVSVLLQKAVRMLQNASQIDKEEATNMSAEILKSLPLNVSDVFEILKIMYYFH